MLKRRYDGTYHHITRDHLYRYVSEFADRHNIRYNDIIEMMDQIAIGMMSQHLRYDDLFNI